MVTASYTEAARWLRMAAAEAESGRGGPARHFAERGLATLAELEPPPAPSLRLVRRDPEPLAKPIARVLARLRPKGE